MKKVVARYKQIARAKRRFVFRCLEGWRFPARAHPQDVVQVQPQPGVKLVGSTGYGRIPGGCLVLKVIVLKWQSRGVCRIHLPLDPLPAVQTPLERSKPVGL